MDNYELKKTIPVCDILGVKIAAINMNWLINYIKKYINEIKGNYICVSNVHTTVMSTKNERYCKIQNEGLMALPDGKPLSLIGRKRGYRNMDRVTGPDLMGKIFEISEKENYSHYFYGSTEETLEKLQDNLHRQYPTLSISGMYSPPFRTLNEDEDEKIVENINKNHPTIVWVGLGAPKQEIWMANHKHKINSLMIGVGAGFDYYAGNIKRAPKWMQKCCLEWLYRLLQDPRRLFGRYLITNFSFVFKLLFERKQNG